MRVVWCERFARSTASASVASGAGRSATRRAAGNAIGHARSTRNRFCGGTTSETSKRASACGATSSPQLLPTSGARSAKIATLTRRDSANEWRPAPPGLICLGWAVTERRNASNEGNREVIIFTPGGRGSGYARRDVQDHKRHERCDPRLPCLPTYRARHRVRRRFRQPPNAGCACNAETRTQRARQRADREA
jgi:hypothetical protein